MVHRVLVVDDDKDLREALFEQFQLHDEFSVTMAENASQALDKVRNNEAEIVLLDVDLPDMDGREACRRMRKDGFKGTVIMLTAQSSDADQILGLDSGANDYVTKPFRFAVLLARIRSQLRQRENSEDATFAIAHYNFQPGAKLLVDDKGAKIRLTEKETAILRYLYRAGEKPVGREILLTEVWGYNSAVTTHTLETHIYRLRQKIEKDPAHAQIVVTEEGGYRLVP